MGRLAGKIAFITGTASGQGRAAALLFAREGAAIYGCDLHEGTEETADLVRAAGGTMSCRYPVDLGDSAAAAAWVEAGIAEFGGIDILYNNASAVKVATVAEMTDEQWHFTMRNELDLVFFVCRAAWPHLIARGGGSVINVGSIQGMCALPQTRGGFAHAATKAGVIGMTRELAADGGKHRIRANCVSPGLIATPIVDRILKNDELRKSITDLQILPELGQPEDVAHAALFLASDEAKWITGANLPVDGGYTAR
ncbi:SDR family NAD(P)-dependent oxidoreductase [Burkholderia orbicola]|uniref:SDR family NAD(P)-dependent oxidoreductase n=1 Tax=Burkholderia orbicola TaxID=2978683 RepID=UPI0039A58733